MAKGNTFLVMYKHVVMFFLSCNFSSIFQASVQHETSFPSLKPI